MPSVEKQTNKPQTLAEISKVKFLNMGDSYSGLCSNVQKNTEKPMSSHLRSSEHLQEVMGIDKELEKRTQVQESLFSDS